MRKSSPLSAAALAAFSLAFPARARALGLEALSAQAGLKAPSALADMPVPSLPPGGVQVAPLAARRRPADPSEPAASSGHAAPNWQLTPGKLCTTDDPNFKEYRYAERIPYCQRNVTHDMKLQIAQSYGVPESDWPSYEFDHLIPLAVGGNSSVDNLWPQPRGADGSDAKDQLENQLYHEMVDGTLTQADAVRQIYAWFDGAAFAAAALKGQPPAPAPALAAAR